jgi:hypothetical protein
MTYESEYESYIMTKGYKREKQVTEARRDPHHFGPCCAPGSSDGASYSKMHEESVLVLEVDRVDWITLGESEANYIGGETGKLEV